MGRKKRGRRRRRSEAAQLAAKYNERRLEGEVDDALVYQTCKKEYSEHAKQVAKREEELLSRTIFVTNVKDLRSHRNLALLRDFFVREYGQVEQCILASYSGKGGRGGRFPKARLRFRHEGDAKAIFGGRKLSLVESPVHLHDSKVGHRGFLRVFPSRPYQGMDESHDENKVILTGDSMFVGHYCPFESDEDIFTGQDRRDGSRDCHEFLIEDTIHYKVKMSIDIDSRTVQIRLLHAEDYMLSFRFKDIQGTMGCFCEGEDGGGSFAIVFHLKYPPRIYELRRELDVDGVEQEIATRYLEMGGVSSNAFGTCYGYMLRVSRSNLQSLFADQTKLRKLKRFGLINHNLYSPGDSPHISTLSVHGRIGRVDTLLRLIRDRRVGKFVPGALVFLLYSVVLSAVLSSIPSIPSQQGYCCDHSWITAVSVGTMPYMIKLLHLSERRISLNW